MPHANHYVAFLGCGSPFDPPLAGSQGKLALGLWRMVGVRARGGARCGAIR